MQAGRKRRPAERGRGTAATAVVVVGLLVALSLLVLMRPADAGAHAFLIRSQPEPGARLSSSPSELALFFSEPFIDESARVTLRHADGTEPAIPKPVIEDAVVRQLLPPDLSGVLVIAWRVLSDDGHVSAGEFAFAVGSLAALPQQSGSSAGTSLVEVVASWLLFAGLALALGGLFSERFVWRRALDSTGRGVRAPLRAGLILALAGSLLHLVSLAGNRVGEGLASGLDADALTSVIGVRPGGLTVGILAALAAAVLCASSTRPRVRLCALGPLGAVVVLSAFRGHSGTSGAWWAIPADAIHLLTGALWVGALFHLVLVLWRCRGRPRRQLLAAAVAHYARFAPLVVVLIVASGLVTALAQFESLDELTETGYGRTLVVKGGFVALALALAGLARSRVAPAQHARGPAPGRRLPIRGRTLRRLGTGEAAALAGVLALAAILVNVAPPGSSAKSPPVELGAPPLQGPAVRLADLAGQLTVGLAAAQDELRFRVLVPSGPVASATLEVEIEQKDGLSADLYPRPCGRGCFTIQFSPPEGQAVLTATVSASGWQGGTARFELDWPPGPDQTQLLERVERTMSTIPELVLVESVTSGPGSTPTRTRYQLSGTELLDTELYRSGAVDVRVLNSSPEVTELGFALTGSDVWYRISIDSHHRIQREHIVSPGHLIERDFSYPQQN